MKQQEVTIGKYTLESLTNGMYATPLDLYREYIQNSVDSIDEAIKNGLDKKESFYLDISVCKEEKAIRIFDNGTGIEQQYAVKCLIDIGNSNKNRINSRGFRGIGRLAGLGYCNQLVFTTSFVGESYKTIVEFDAQKLGLLLMDRNSNIQSANEVLEQVITVKKLPEKAKRHYFLVELKNVKNAAILLDEVKVKDYLLQYAPLRYSNEFKWQNPIKEKAKINGCDIKSYIVTLNGEELYKPYRDSFISDRIQKYDDVIKDIEVVTFYRNEKLSAILWCAKSNYYGTIIDNAVKGIRIRQGNILIGNHLTCNSFFREERFNGWLIGEIHILDEDLIVNARRDDFERNEAYDWFVEKIKEWTAKQSKEIRQVSYERNLSLKNKALVEAEQLEDVNDLLDESLEYVDVYGESDFLNKPESDMIAQTDYISKISNLINQKKLQTKYLALNINTKLTIEQRKTLERVFDIITKDFEKKKADKIISVISNKF